MLLEWLGILGLPSGGVVGVYRFLKGRRPRKVVRAENNEVLLEIDGHTMPVPLEVMRLYQDIAVNKASNKLLSTVDGGTGIEKVEFRGEKEPREKPSFR